MIWIPIGISAIVLFVLVGAYAAFAYVLKSPHKGQNDPRRTLGATENEEQENLVLSLVDGLLERPFEQVFIKSYDGKKLAAKYYHNKDGAPLAILFHGYRGVAERDFCGGATLLLEKGHNVLLVDQRAHCASKGNCLTFGIKERKDCLCWVNFAVNRFGKDVDIFLYGISMGGATVLMASELPLPQNVRGIVADCPYSSPREIVRKVCRDKKLVEWFFYPFVWLGALIFGGFNLSKGDAVEAVKKAQVPILIIHGASDTFVPCDMSRRVQAANPQKVTLEEFAEAEHGVSYLVDTPRYTRLIDEFIASVLAQK